MLELHHALLSKHRRTVRLCSSEQGLDDENRPIAFGFPEAEPTRPHSFSLARSESEETAA